MKYNLNKGQRSLCAQLRTGTLPLAIETGRFNATPEEERLCLLCELGEIENEVHFLFYCPTYEDLRDVLFTKMSSVYADFFWLDEYAKLELCFRKGTFFCCRFYLSGLGENILFNTEL